MKKIWAFINKYFNKYQFVDAMNEKEKIDYIARYVVTQKDASYFRKIILSWILLVIPMIMNYCIFYSLVPNTKELNIAFHYSEVITIFIVVFVTIRYVCKYMHSSTEY